MAAMVGEVVFVDTSVLLSATDESRSHHEEARRLIAESGTRGVHLAASGQILREYLVVATMAAHGIRTLVTENEDDFTAFDEIETVTIARLTAGA